jgi:hypothetical protein
MGVLVLITASVTGSSNHLAFGDSQHCTQTDAASTYACNPPTSTARGGGLEAGSAGMTGGRLGGDWGLSRAPIEIARENAEINFVHVFYQYNKKLIRGRGGSAFSGKTPTRGGVGLDRSGGCT